MTDREKFEAWAKTKNCDLEKFSRGEKEGQYKNPVVEKMREAWQAALASQQPADDGWIEWAGGISPVADDVMVELRLRNGEIDQNIAYWVDWFHSKPTDELDIIAYRLVKP